MRLENEYVHYRARFEVFPLDTTDSPLPYIVSSLQRWVDSKEGRHSARSAETPIRVALERDEVNLLHEGLSHNPCYMSPSLVVGESIPSGYYGDVNFSKTTKLCSSSYVGKGSELLPEYWALEYDEPPAGSGDFRHWHTSVGVTTPHDGPSVVNVRISNYMLPTYVGRIPSQPHCATPRFVKELIDLRGFNSCGGETVFHTEPIILTADNFASEFSENLLSAQREIPLVLVMSDRDGGSPAGKLEDFAAKLCGLANVYVANASDGELRDKLAGLFRRDDPSYSYGCGTDTIRVYKPHVDLSNEPGSHRHRFFTRKDIGEFGDSYEEACEDFSDAIARSLMGAKPLDERDVIDVGDVRDKERALDVHLARKRLDEIKSEAVPKGDFSARLEDIARIRLPEGKGLGELQERVADLEERNRQLEAKNAEAYDFAEKMIDSEKGESEKTRRELEHANQQHAQELADVEEERDEALAASYAAKDELARAKSAADESREAARAWDGLDSIPTTLPEMLGFIGSHFPERVVILDEALKSAEKFNPADIDECWQVLRTVPKVLWDLYFGWGADRSLDLEDEFQSRTGFRLSLNEGKLTNANARMMAERRRRYLGEDIMVVPHIKGKQGRSSSQVFRVYFYASPVDKKIVVGHCGKHLTTAGTDKL